MMRKTRFAAFLLCAVLCVMAALPLIAAEAEEDLLTIMPEDPFQSLIPDEEMAELIKLPPEEAAEKISTVSDALAWIAGQELKVFTENTAMAGDLRFENIRVALREDVRQCASEIMCALTAYMLADDFEEIGYITAPVYQDEQLHVLNALYIGEEDGWYWIFSPNLMYKETYGTNTLQRGFMRVETDDLSKLADVLVLNPSAADGTVLQILAAPYQQKLQYYVRDMLLAPAMGRTEAVFCLTEEEIEEVLRAEADAKDRAAKAKASAPYVGVYSADEIQAMARLSLDGAAEKISTVSDALAYLDACGKTARSRCSNVKLSPAFAMEKWKNGMYGCETLCVLTAYLLADDYEEIGFIVLPTETQRGADSAFGLYIRCEEGYLLVSPSGAMRDELGTRSSALSFGTTVIDDLAQAKKYIVPNYSCEGSPVRQIFAAPYQEELSFAPDGDYLKLVSGEAEEIFRDNAK